MPELSAKEKIAWLRLARTPKIGPVTFSHLLAHCGSAGAALAAAPRMARHGGGDLKIASEDDAIRELEALDKLGGRLMAACEPDYPRALAALEAPPPVISVLGHPVLFRKETVAIVGARNASALGRKLAGKLAADLGKAGLGIASGLARGIDAAAHEAALPTGTVAVVAGGVDVVYPPENEGLYRRIVAEGAVISEMPPGQAPQARHFPRRNRLISGLCRGVVVVEAAEGSGSLITANYAVQQNREVFAVPGSPLDPRAKGANRLLREGATLTETADDVLGALAPILGADFADPATEGPAKPAGMPETEDLSPLRTALDEALSPAPVAIDELIRLTGAPVGAVLTVILELELAGKLNHHPGNKVSRG